jgi:hypothetical protein
MKMNSETGKGNTITMSRRFPTILSATCSAKIKKKYSGPIPKRAKRTVSPKQPDFYGYAF